MSVAAQQAQTEAASVAGTYDGSQTEMAATLELGENGRYRYAMSYGAVDEFSSGTWARNDGGIVLNSDPSTPPQFELLGTETGSAPKGTVRVHLEGVGNLPLSLFSVIVERGDGTSATVDFSDAGVDIPVSAADETLSISLAMPMYEIRGEPITVPAPAGKAFYFIFHANDLGFKAFKDTILFESDGMFLLDRYDRQIVFRKVPERPDASFPTE
ncbi:MAG TPA: hypothetical protein VJQ77_04870 [Novosphingobium sp.]|nr:hypothetical protein [Novosphingobium sp.]